MFDNKPHYLIPLLAFIIGGMLVSQIPLVRAIGGLTLDGAGNGSCTIITQCSIYTPGFSTIGSHDLVILQVLLNTTGTAMVTSNQGLTWTKRAEVADGLGGMESEWYAVANQVLSNPSIGITVSVPKTRIGVEIFAISGYDPASPFDPSAKAPTTAMGTSNTMSATISTNAGSDMLIGLGYGGKGAIIPGPGFTGICINADGCAIGNLDSISSEYKMVTTPQLGTVVSVTQTGGTSWGFIADAVLSELPTVTSVSPSKGAVGAPLTITGASFTNVATLTFCGKAQSFTIASDQIIWTSAPQISSPSNIQTCDIVVTGGAGSSRASVADQFSFLPNVSSLSPSTGSNGTEVRVTGTSFVGTTGVTFCGVSQRRHTVINDTQIRFTIYGPGLTASKSCDIVVTNSIGNSSTSGNDVFSYVPQSQGGGTTHAPNAPTISNKTLYIILAGIAAVALIAVVGLMRRWDPGKKGQNHVRIQEEPASNPPLPAR